jgi:hypothetical protein
MRPEDHRRDGEDRTDLVGCEVEAERDDQGDHCLVDRTSAPSCPTSVGGGPRFLFGRLGHAHLAPQVRGRAMNSDRLAAGTAPLALGSAAALPFCDCEFSAVTAVFAPVNPA